MRRNPIAVDPPPASGIPRHQRSDAPFKVRNELATTAFKFGHGQASLLRLTPELIDRLCALVANSIPLDQAAQLCRLPRTTLRQWMRLGQGEKIPLNRVSGKKERYIPRMPIHYELVTRLAEAEAKGMGVLIQRVHDAGKGGVPVRSKIIKVIRYMDGIDEKTGMPIRIPVLEQQTDETTLTPPDLRANIWLLEKHPEFRKTFGGSLGNGNGTSAGTGDGSSENDDSLTSGTGAGNGTGTGNGMPAFIVQLESKPDKPDSKVGQQDNITDADKSGAINIPSTGPNSSPGPVSSVPVPTRPLKIRADNPYSDTAIKEYSMGYKGGHKNGTNGNNGNGTNGNGNNGAGNGNGNGAGNGTNGTNGTNGKH